MLKRLARRTFTVPVVAVTLAVCSEYLGSDIWLSRHFYDFKLGTWPYKAHWLTQDLLHNGGRHLVVAMAIVLLLLFVGSFFRSELKPYRKELAFVLVAGLSGPAIIGGLKGLTHIYSPWDLQLFGGKQPYIRIFDHVPVSAAVGHGFPAAHASGGFAWFSIYFALLRRGLHWHRLSLILPVSLGLLFGLAQQARGAHFLSHDLVSLAICWMCAVVWTRLFYAPAPYPAINDNSLSALVNHTARN
jgi:membrane-associated PAP2 superfamily phosphatase